MKSYQLLTLLNKLLVGLSLLILFILSPIASILLLVYYFTIWQALNILTRVLVTFIISLFFIVISLFNLDLLSLAALFKHNWHLLISTNSSDSLSVLIGSITEWKTNLWGNGLLSLIGLFWLGFNFLIYIIFRLKMKGVIDELLKKCLPEPDAVFFGKDISGQRLFIPDKELNQHALVMGTTGSGKTTTLLNIVDSCCSRGLPLIYIDGKGSLTLVNKINQLCNGYGRRLKVFTVDPHNQVPGLSSYNPLAFGNFTEWKNKLITLTGEAENKGQEHYQIQEQSYINLVCEILNKSRRMVDFEGLLGYIKHPEQLQKVANQISPELAKRFAESKAYDNETADIIKVLEMFYYSHYGQLFSTSNKDSVINLRQSLIDGEIVVFLLDAASFKRDTNLLGNLIINDINAAWSSFGREGNRINGYCVFDEFAAYASPNMANILAMQRDNGLHAVIGTQSINAIAKENNTIKRIAVELIANCNTYIIHKLNDPEDISLLEETIGKDKTYAVTISSGNDDSTRKVSAKVVDEFILNGQEIRKLSSGYSYIYRSVKQLKPQKVKINNLLN